MAIPTNQCQRLQQLPEPTKPILPPPPPPPLSLTFLEKPYFTIPTSFIRLNTEQLLYNSFLNTHVLKFKDSSLYKSCNSIDLSSLSYLTYAYHLQTANTTTKTTKSADSTLKITTVTTITTTKVKKNKLNIIKQTTKTTTSHNSTTATLLLPISSISYLSSSKSPSNNNNNNMSLLQNFIYQSNNQSSSFMTKMNANTYIKQLFDSLYSNPYQFFVETLLIPLVFMFLFMLVVFVGILFKKWCNSRAVNGNKKSASSSSASSFIVGYGTARAGSANCINSTLVSSLDSTSLIEAKKRFFDSNKLLHSDHISAELAIYGNSFQNAEPPAATTPNIIDKSFMHEPKYYKMDYSNNLSTFGRVLKMNDTTACKEVILDSGKLTPPDYSELEKNESYMKYLKRLNATEPSIMINATSLNNTLNSVSDSSRAAFPRTNPKFKQANNKLNDESNTSFNFDLSSASSSFENPTATTIAEQRLQCFQASASERVIDVCSKL